MKTKQITVEELWREYRDACYPPKNGKLDPVQETETRQAFYAGMLTASKVMLESAVNMTEEEAMRNMKTMMDYTQDVCRARIYELERLN